jgi:hypothetical protein
MGGLVGLVVATYLIAVAINWHDREPSAVAAHFANAYRDRPAIADENNAFVYAMGFAVVPGENPQQVGLKRLAWMWESSRLVPPYSTPDPLGNRIDPRIGRNAAVQTFLDACTPGNVKCAAAFATGDEVFEQWVASEGWLLERYQAFLSHSGWRETAPLDLAAPLPSYGRIVEGQKLLLLKAKVLAKRGDYRDVSMLLEEDLSFWRRVLESSDTLISKMIATAAITRHFELGNLILREVPSSSVISVVPPSWSVAITPSERSMRRCLVGEWVWASTVYRNVGAAAKGPGDDSLLSRIETRLMAPLYQPQDSLNRDAEYLSEMADLQSVPLDQYEEAAQRTKQLSERVRADALPPRSMYNIVGRLLVGLGAYDFGAYGRRVADIEGTRRAALAAVTLRGANVPADQVAQALAASPLQDPYHNRPFEWQEKDGIILFRGLELSERAEHRIRY